MSNPKEHYFITNESKRRFKIWLLDNNLTLSTFAKKCGCSRQYISQILNGQLSITATVREWFKKGGYELL